MTAEFEKMQRTLSGAEPPRVWSLLVTVFGDLAQTGNAAVSSSLLNAIAARVGLKPEATRVALHRLRKDDWIEGHRSGRRSSYTLTQQGRAQSAAASPVIYRREPISGPTWVVLRDPAAGSDRSGDEVWVSSTVGLSTTAPTSPDVLAVALADGQPIPDWMSDRVCPASSRRAANVFLTKLNGIQRDLPEASALTPIEIATLRVLIVHEWRRIVLRVPDLPDQVFPKDWVGPDARRSVAQCLDALPRPDLEALNLEAIAPAVA